MVKTNRLRFRPRQYWRLLLVLALLCSDVTLVAAEWPQVNDVAEQSMVTGQVLDENGEPVIGATVTVKGSNTTAVTDLDGRFAIRAGRGTTLAVTYVGYGTTSVQVDNARLVITIRQDAQQLDEVVVTALGIKKEAKSLSYNVQQVGAEALMTVQDANFVNSLAGKVAGVTINASATGVGGSSRVIMRGAKSINGNNNVLYVIDGIPMQNLAAEQPEGIFAGAGQTGDATANINPDDIESISALTGPTAAALYGANAANGVIIINTKRGRAGRVDVTYNGSFQFSHPLVLPRLQHEYGPSETGSYFSWGERLATPSSYRAADFFQTGTNIANSVSLSTGSDKNQTYLSLARPTPKASSTATIWTDIMFLSATRPIS